MQEEIKKYREYCLKILNQFSYIKINNPIMFLEENRAEVFLGLATSGLGQKGKKDYILEIYALKRSIKGEIIGSFHTYVNDYRLKSISSEVSSINKITMDTIKTAPSIFQVISNLKMFIQDDIIIAHNIDFVWKKFLEADFNDFGIYCNNITLCTLKLSKKIFQELCKYNLKDLTEYLGISFNETIYGGVKNNVALMIGLYEAIKEYKYDIDNDITNEKKRLFDDYYNSRLEVYKEFTSNYEFEEFLLVNLNLKNQMATVAIKENLYDLYFNRDIFHWDLKSLKEKDGTVHNINIVELNKSVRQARLKGA